MSQLVATGSFTITDIYNGTRTASLDVYQWAATAPTTFPSGTSTYNWAAGSFTAPATLNGWSLIPPIAVAGQTLWVCYTTYSDTLTTTTSSVTWSASVSMPIGAAGTNAVSYNLSLSSSVITRSVVNVLTPASITASIYSVTGASTPVLYAGRFIIATSLDGVTYTTVYTSATDESSHAYTIPVTASTIKVSAYLAGGTVTKIDEEIITIVSDGANGINSVNNIIAVLSNENQGIPSDNVGVTGAFSAVSTMSVYNGAVNDSANWTYTKVDSNTTSTITGATATVTAMSADIGIVTITATRAEASQVNIMSGSETFDTTQAWTDFYSSVVSTIPAPNGSLTARKVTAPVAGLILPFRKVQTFPADTYSTGLYIYVPTQIGVNYWNFSNDFQDTTVVTPTVGGATPCYIFDKWVWVEGTATTSTPLAWLDWNFSFNGVAVPSGGVFHVWGAMCKSGAAAGKYIPYLAPVSKVFTLAKNKAGITGATGPSVLITESSALAFTSTDGVLDSGTGANPSIVLTANVSGIVSPTYIWTFSGFAVSPVNSGAATQTITAAQFGSSQSAKVSCTVGSYFDTVTIVALNKTTAAAGATVGATINNTYTIADAPFVTGMTTTTGVVNTTYTPATGNLVTSALANISASTTSVTITASASNVLTSGTHGMATGSAFTYTASGTTISGLVSGTVYYAVVVSDTTFKVAATYANAVATTPVVITLGALTGGITYTATVNVLTTSAAHNFTVGQKILYTVASGTTIPGLVNGTAYFITAPTATTFSLSTTAAIAAVSGGNVSIGALQASSTYTVSFYNWAYSGYSTTSQPAASGAKVTFTVTAIAGSYMVGLNTDPTTNNSYISLDFAIYIAGANYQVYENGVARSLLFPITAGDKFAVIYDGNLTVSYYHNGVNFYSTVLTSALTLPLFVDTSALQSGVTIYGIGFSAYVAPALASSGNLVGQIHRGNVSTYIANLAVDTLQIASNAVAFQIHSIISPLRVIGSLSLPYPLSDTYGYTNGVWYTFLSISVNMTGGTTNSILTFFNYLSIVQTVYGTSDCLLSLRIIDSSNNVFASGYTWSPNTGITNVYKWIGDLSINTNSSTTYYYQYALAIGAYSDQTGNVVYTSSCDVTISGYATLIGSKSSV